MTISTCNANCVFCPYIESWHYKNQGIMNIELFKKILNDLEPFKNLDTICPYLMNEPLCDKRIFDLIRLCYDHYPDVIIEFSTNGFLFNRKNIDNMIKLFKDKPHQILISHHGINETTFEHIMHLPYKETINRILRLLKKSDNNLNIKIKGLGISIGNMIEYFSKDDYYSYWMNLLDKNKITFPLDNIQYSVFHSRADTIKREERNANFFRYGKVRLITKENPFYCLRLDEIFHVLYNGEVSLCCMDYYKEVNLGNIINRTIEEYYNSDNYINLTNIMNGINTPSNWICTRCISPGG